MGHDSALAGHDGGLTLDRSDHTTRDQLARTNLEWLAPGDHALLADMLGLCEPSTRRVSSMPLTDPSDGGKRARSKPAVDHAAEHGTYSRYNNGGCRCPHCKAASAQYRRSKARS